MAAKVAAGHSSMLSEVQHLLWQKLLSGEVAIQSQEDQLQSNAMICHCTSTGRRTVSGPASRPSPTHLRTPPTTTISATLHTRSCASRGVSLRPRAALNRLTANRKRASRGSGPEARPPKVLRRVPLERSWLVSQRGICEFEHHMSKVTCWTIRIAGRYHTVAFDAVDGQSWPANL